MTDTTLINPAGEPLHATAVPVVESSHPLVATQADLQAARAHVPAGSATFSGTMTTVGPGVALVGILAWWYNSTHSTQLPDSVIIYATIIVTGIAHAIKQFLIKLYPQYFADAPIHPSAGP